MIEPLDIEVLDDKKVILYDIVDYDDNITNSIISEEKKREIEKLKVKTDGRYRFISELGSLSVLLTKVVTVTPSHESIPYSTTMFGIYTFADGTPFGVKNE